jgi:tripartite-type tricarboxylate transporter receptor subunit TctC
MHFALEHNAFRITLPIELQLAMSSPSVIREFVNDMPEIPTTAEAGFPQLVADNSYGLFAPAGTPAPMARLHAALPDVRDRTRARGRGRRQQLA